MQKTHRIAVFVRLAFLMLIAAACATACAQVAGLGDLERVDCLDDCDGGNDVSIPAEGGHDAMATEGGRDGAVEAGCPTCSGATPVCDTATSTCVACVANADCAPGTICANKTCKPGCAADHASCGADGGDCDIDAGVCRQCLKDADCGGSSPRCDLETFQCVPCLPTNDNCATGTRCVKQGVGNYTCARGCRTVADCFVTGDGGAGDGGDAGHDAGASTIACCNNTCIDTSLDTNNCGACGNTCGADGGTANACCNSVCKDTQTDPDHCGSCNATACSGNHVTSRTCAAGQCTSACTVGFADCNSDKRTDGCEISTATDPDHCGACAGAVCSNNNMATRTCAGGTCVGTCAANFSDCNGDKLTDGCEVNITTDPNHCGGCIGKVCSNNNVPTPTCAGGICNGACSAGFLDCNANKLTDGCETNDATDPNNCGGCNFVCSSNNMASRTCAGSSCNGNCVAGTADCNANKLTDGCEITTSTDPNNCGACGTVCSANNMATRTCGGNACNGSCTAGFADCNSNKQTDGCETSTTTTTDCSGCGLACNITTSTARSCNGATCSYTCSAGRADCNAATAPNLDGCECARPACGGNGCANSATCPTTTHSNGVGLSYYDCTATGTYNVSQAHEACTAYAISQGHDSTYCLDFGACAGGAPTVCYSSNPGGAPAPCTTYCWGYTAGKNAGWVESCACPDAQLGGTTTWN